MQPKPPLTPLSNGDGRQKVCNLLAIFNISRSQLYRMMEKNAFPPPDLTLGRTPFWNNSTIAKFIATQQASASSQIKK